MLSIRLKAEQGAPARDLPVLTQSAALCHRVENGRLKVLLVTTRRSQNWVIPKGWPIKGLTASETAAQEAWEEAGVLGQCAPRPLGQFSYIKNRPDKGAAFCVVDVFALQVQRLVDEFPEVAERRRKWCTPKSASCHVRSLELANLLRGFGVNPN